MADPRQPKAFIFDLLTALMDSWSLWNECAGSDDLGLAWRLEYINITYNCGSYAPYESLVAQAATQIRKQGHSLPQDAENALVQKWATGLRPWDDTISTLAQLKRKHPSAKLGVFTNCSVELGNIAARNCEDPAQDISFDKILTAEEVGYYKPHPATYQAILDALDISDPKDAVFVAGSSVDVPGSRAAGMRVVWHNRIGLPPKDGAKPDREGKTLQEALSDYL